MTSRVLIFIGILANSVLFAQDLLSVKIGAQVWTVKNYDVDSFSNGEKIKQVNSKEEWFKAGYRGEPAWCYNNFDEQYANLGKLYNYFAICDARNLAPDGWRIPKFEDYFQLINYIEPLCTKEYFSKSGSLAGGSLKSKNGLWKDSACPQIESNFSAIAAGGYSPSIDYPEYDWDPIGEKAMFWCFTEWEKMSEYIDAEHLKRFQQDLISGEFNDKAIVFRLRNYDCKIDADDDPKINGYYLRLIKEN
jgi:uncharacterized protein (TIGR02145 family)